MKKEIQESITFLMSEFKRLKKKQEKEELTEEQQMEAWGEYLKETDSGHRPS